MNSWKTIQLSEICEVWESWHGWYWFVTEYHEGTLAFGLVRGWEIEWGYFDLSELRQLRKQSKVWKVPKRNWALCPCVTKDAASYSRGTGVRKVSKDDWHEVSGGNTGERRWPQNDRTKFQQ